MSGVVGGDLDDMRSIAAALERTAGELLTIAQETGGAAMSGALLGSILFSPGTAAVAEKELVEAAIAPALVSARASALALFLRTKAELLEIAGSGLIASHVDASTESILGFAEGVGGLVEVLSLANQLSLRRALTDPLGWSRDAAALGEGVVWGVTHPVEFGAAIIDWDTWRTNPARAYGRLVPDLLVAAATVGTGTVAGGVSRGARAVRVADEAQSASGAVGIAGRSLAPVTRQPTRRLPDGGLKAHENRGGHTMEEHVGKLDEYLRKRLDAGVRDPSTFTDEAIADDAVATVVARHERLIQTKLAAGKKKVELPPVEFDWSVGRVMAPDGTTFSSTRVRVIVVPDASPLGYHVLTAFPTR